MVERMQIYKCELCGNIVEVMHAGKGTLVCCGKPMNLMEENSIDAAKEKHVPVVELEGNEIKVQVGSVSHPMNENHYIEWIELVDAECGFSQIKYLKSGDEPIARFSIESKCIKHVYARAYCNLHGHWKSN